MLHGQRLQKHNPASDRLLEIIDDHDLSQHVKEPTRRDRNTQNILDLILSNNSNIIENVSVVPGISDHDIVLFTVNISCRRKKNVKGKIFIRKKADSTRIKEELTKLPLHMYTRGFNSIDEKWRSFEDNIHRIPLYGGCYVLASPQSGLAQDIIYHGSIIL